MCWLSSCLRWVAGHFRIPPDDLGLAWHPALGYSWPKHREETTLKTHHYKLRIIGLADKEGQIKAHALLRVLEALLETAERTTRLIATGEGSAKGTRPAWLTRCLDLTVTGLSPGSTILGLDAPCLSEAAGPEAFEQKDLWRESPDDEDTALDLAALAIAEVGRPDSPGDRFDASVLEAVMGFQKAVRDEGARFQLIPSSPRRGRFELTDATFALVRERRTQLPEPRAFIVHGKLDEIRHSGGRFRLQMDNGHQLPGRLHVEFLSGESLRPLWGHPATIEGMVHFKLNGQPRFIEARKISAPAAGDAVFSVLPQVPARIAEGELFPELAQPTRDSDPMSLWGCWPGDEPLDELMDLLR